MNAQTLTTRMMTRQFVVATPEAETISAASRDYGFDFDEAELAEELVAPLPTVSALSDAEVLEFERALQYHFS